MAQGRFISKSISTNEELGGVSFAADYLFARCIPHLDVEGRMSGNAGLVRATVCPLRREMTDAIVAGLLAELAGAYDVNGEPLVEWYEVGGRQYLYFPGFGRQQAGLRKDREGKSRIPPATHDGATPVKLPEDAGSPPATTAEEVRSRSGLEPAEEKFKGSISLSVSEGSVDKSTGSELPSSYQQNVENQKSRLVLSTLTGLVRRSLYGELGSPPEGRTVGQDYDTLATLLDSGNSIDDVEGMVVGLGILRDNGDLRPVVEPGESVSTGLLITAPELRPQAINAFLKTQGSETYQSGTSR